MTVSKVTLHIGHAVSVDDMTAVGSTFELPITSEKTLPDGTTEVGIFIADERMRKLLGYILLSSVKQSDEQAPASLTVAIDSQELARVLLPQLVNELRGKSDVRSL